MEDILSQKAAQTIQFCSPDDNCKLSARILLVNLLQSSRSTFSRGSFPSFFAFKEGMLGAPTSVSEGWPTVSARFLRLLEPKLWVREPSSEMFLHWNRSITIWGSNYRITELCVEADSVRTRCQSHAGAPSLNDLRFQSGHDRTSDTSAAPQ